MVALLHVGAGGAVDKGTRTSKLWLAQLAEVNGPGSKIASCIPKRRFAVVVVLFPVNVFSTSIKTLCGKLLHLSSIAC